VPTSVAAPPRPLQGRTGTAPSSQLSLPSPLAESCGTRCSTLREPRQSNVPLVRVVRALMAPGRRASYADVPVGYLDVAQERSDLQYLVRRWTSLHAAPTLYPTDGPLGYMDTRIKAVLSRPLARDNGCRVLTSSAGHIYQHGRDRRDVSALWMRLSGVLSTVRTLFPTPPQSIVYAPLWPSQRQRRPQLLTFVGSSPDNFAERRNSRVFQTAHTPVSPHQNETTKPDPPQFFRPSYGRRWRLWRRLMAGWGPSAVLRAIA